MENCGEFDSRIAEAIRGPRLYAQESLPSGPAWSDVQRILAHTEGDSLADVRDRAILMFLAIYGVRSGDVRSLRLDRIDWPGCVLRVFRLKKRQPEVYPLLQSVAEAVALHRYRTPRGRSSKNLSGTAGANGRRLSARCLLW
jgi:integrase/recombinase XerD